MGISMYSVTMATWHVNVCRVSDHFKISSTTRDPASLTSISCHPNLAGWTACEKSYFIEFVGPIFVSASETKKKMTAVSWLLFGNWERIDLFSEHLRPEIWNHSMVLSSLTIALWSGGLITGWWLSRFLRGHGSDSNRLPLPPGPKGYPIIDNLLDVPTDKSWQTFDQWSKIYGMSCIDQNPTYSLRATHRRYGIFQDTWPAISCPRERGKDLWSIRETLIQLLWSSTFAHVQWIVRRLFYIYVWTRSLESRMDFMWNMGFHRYGLQWKSHRRAFHNYFHQNIVHRYHSTQINTTRAFLRRLLNSPDDFMLHIRQ